MHLRFGKGRGDSQDHAPAVVAAHSDRGEDRAVPDTATDAKPS